MTPAKPFLPGHALARARADEDAAWRAEITRHTTYTRLAFHYGEDRSYAIINGEDGATQADIAKWRGLGRRA